MSSQFHNHINKFFISYQLYFINVTKQQFVNFIIIEKPIININFISKNIFPFFSKLKCKYTTKYM